MNEAASQMMTQRINDLWTAMNAIQQNVNFSITIMWTVLAFVVVAISTAVAIIARTWITQMVEVRVKEVERNITQSVIDIVNKQYRIETVGIPPGNTMDLPVRQGPLTSKNPLVFVSPHGQDVRYSWEVKDGRVYISNLLSKESYQWIYLDVLIIDRDIY